jgi:protein ImuB
VATVGLAESRATARVAARLGRAVTVVAAGRERETLAGASLALLEPDPETAVTLARWGVRTLGELAALPREGLGARLGAPGLRLHDLARGLDREPFRAYTPPPFYQEAQGLDWEIDTLEALAVVLASVLERVCARLVAGHLAADVLDVELRLVSGEHHQRRVSLAHPLGDVRAMLALIRLDLEAHPPAAAVTGVAITAHPVRAVAGQRGLWQPSMPAVRELATVLARLAALVGPASVGSPRVVDSHRPDAVELARFDPASVAPIPEDQQHRDHALALRRLRPPRSIDVESVEGMPSSVRWSGTLYRVMTSAGPWRTSGDWWDVDGWARDEWDVALSDGTLCRIALDLRNGGWSLDGVYD